MKRPLLTIIAPVYNEEEVIARFYNEVARVLRGIEDRYRWELLFVVDRSSDNTLEILREIARQDAAVRVLALSSRFGHQMSLLAGIDAARNADVLVMMDSDLQHPPALIPTLLESYEGGSDVVYTIRRDTVSAGWFRKALGNLFYKFLGFVSSTKINANAADFRLISKRVAAVLRDQLRERNLFLRGVISWIGFRQVGVEYIAAEREAGYSKYSIGRMFALATAGILSFTTKPLQLSIVVGAWLAVLSLLFGAFVVVEYFLDDSIPSGWTTAIVLQVFFSGIQLMFLGILGIYIGGIYEEVKGRPHYIVDEEIYFRHE